MRNEQIAAAFDELADILEFQGANQFRVRAYRNAGRTIRDFAESVSNLLEQNRPLTDIAGIGKDLAEKIQEIVITGNLKLLEDLRAEVPESVLKLLRIPGLGPRKAAALHRELKITSLDALRAACESHQVRDLKGFGAKTELAILAGMDLAESADERIFWAEADVYASAIREHFAGCGGISQFEFAGSYRRGKETIGDLDLLVVAEPPDAAMDRLAEFEPVDDVLLRGDTKMSVRLAGGLQVDLRVVPAESFGAALQYFTGSKDHNVIVRGIAKKKGLKVNEWGVFQGDKYIAGRTEEDVYESLGLPYFPPEIREARFEFDWAEAGSLPRLLELNDIRGDLHMHTTNTDGKATLEEMAEAAKMRGLKYIAITDHSKRVSMARGMDAARLRQQWREIDELNGRIKGITILKGVEVDILEKGGLDLDDDVLAEADWVNASVHYGQNQPRAQISKRIIEAIENRYVTAIAHPTGRLINRRKAYEVDLDAVFDAAQRHGKFLELNANPQRLDLDDVACAAAVRRGIPVVISTDAHSTRGLDAMQHGIRQARRGGLAKEQVVNTRSLAQLKKMLIRR